MGDVQSLEWEYNLFARVFMAVVLWLVFWCDVSFGCFTFYERALLCVRFSIVQLITSIFFRFFTFLFRWEILDAMNFAFY